MAKRLTYNDAVARWYDEHPELKALRGTWQAITCATCGYLDETMEPAFWKCSQCLHLVSQPGHLRPVVNLTAVEEDEVTAQETGHYPTLQRLDPYLPYVDPDDPGTPPSAIRTNPQTPAPEPVTAPTAQPVPLPQLSGISCRVVTTKRK